MTEVKLHGSDGAYITTVLVPPMAELPKILIWGSCVFCATADGVFREAFSLQVFTRGEYELMMREGILS